MGKKYKDVEIGDVYGRWTVIGKGKLKNKYKQYWICECSCKKHTMREVDEYNLQTSKSQSCGCINSENLKNKTPNNKKYKDVEINDVYGRWVVVEKGKMVKKGHKQYWWCECSCDEHTKREVFEGSLKQGKSTSCGCINKDKLKEIGINNKKYPKVKIGETYNNWTIIDKGIEIRNKNEFRNYWLCKCSCEYETIKEVREDSLLNGTSKGCKKCSLKKDLTGKTFGDLKVLRLNTKVHSGYNHTFYDVECKCGSTYTVRSDALTSGNTNSCGCSKLEHIDLVGQKFGMLTVLEYVERFNYSKTKNYRTSVNMWKCECECGNIVVMRQGNFTSRNTYSCGCTKRSQGEIAIGKLLKSWGFKYIREYRFDDCKYKNPLPFDFVLLDKNKNIYGAIEFDGEFHYNSIKWGDMTQEDADENLRTTHIRDEIKNGYCLSNNIPLIRVPYWEFNDGNLEHYLFDKLVEYRILEEIKST